jgi:CelD/BcsL family acetyltransferase involved in cellulose biosynthesis
MADELDLPGYRQYYVAMTERFDWPGPLFVAALEVEGRILSSLWALVLNGRFLALVSTFEGGEWNRFSPGRLLLEDVLEWSSSNGITIFDFGLGDESYKLVYSNQAVPLHCVNIPVTVVGKVYQAGRTTKAWRLLKPLAKRVINMIRF